MIFYYWFEILSVHLRGYSTFARLNLKHHQHMGTLRLNIQSCFNGSLHICQSIILSSLAHGDWYAFLFLSWNSTSNNPAIFKPLVMLCLFDSLLNLGLRVIREKLLGVPGLYFNSAWKPHFNNLPSHEAAPVSVSSLRWLYLLVILAV